MVKKGIISCWNLKGLDYWEVLLSLSFLSDEFELLKDYFFDFLLMVFLFEFEYIVDGIGFFFLKLNPDPFLSEYSKLYFVGVFWYKLGLS